MFLCVHCFSKKTLPLLHCWIFFFFFFFEFSSLLKALVRNMIATAVLICDVHSAAGHPLSWQQGSGLITVKQFCGSKIEFWKGEDLELMSCCAAWVARNKRFWSSPSIYLWKWGVTFETAVEFLCYEQIQLGKLLPQSWMLLDLGSAWWGAEPA